MDGNIAGAGGLAISAWLVWILPFIGAAIIAGVARKGKKIRDYTAIGFSLASAIAACHFNSCSYLRS